MSDERLTINHKLKAGALILAIAISLVIALLSSSIILLGFYGSLSFADYSINNRLHLNCSSGINLLLSEQTIIVPDEKKTVDLFGKGMDSVLLQRISWGAFEVMVSESIFKGRKQRKCALVGYSTNDSTGLFLCNTSRPLSLCGKTILKGTCYIPEAGIKRAYIEGQSFTGEKFVDGEIKKSPSVLPSVNKELLGQLSKNLSAVPSPNDSIIEISDQLGRDSILNSFTKKTVFVYSAVPVTLTNETLEGNIKIVSAKKITIGKNTRIKDIVIAAPEVTIEKGFSGSLQVIASDSLVVEEDCRLFYPSSLLLIKSKSVKNKQVVIKANTFISGIVAAVEEEPDVRSTVKISLDKNVTVEGLVYSSGLTDIKGSIYGSLYTKTLVLSTPSSVYENHLLNAVIDPTKRSRYFTSVNLIENYPKRSIAKWLN